MLHTWLLPYNSDEPYARLVFEGKPFPSPAAYYPYSMIAYSYGKVLLTPGQRIGFLALSFGNPQEMPIPGFAEALQKWVPPQDKDWYAYKLNDIKTCETIATSLSNWRGVTFDAQDIAMTSGAFAAIGEAGNGLFLRISKGEIENIGITAVLCVGGISGEVHQTLVDL